jgi:phenylpropionate dioxygenase-like ring-hydroxylating dioxygenase large terminal subunit
VIPTLPRDAYVAGAVWAEERERIFAQQWFVVGRVDDVGAPGDYLRAEVAGEHVLVVRDDDGGLRGFYNVCRHRGAELVDLGAPDRGRLGPMIRCPYHQWTYGLDGQLRRRPFLAPDDGDDGGGDIALHPVGVDTWGGFLFVHLSPASASPLPEHIGAVAARVRRYPLTELRRGVSFHKGELCYPNLLLSLAAEHVAAFTIRPDGPAHTTVICDLLFHPDELASETFDPSDAAELWDLVNRQDWAICESVQRGMSSRVWRGGWFAPMEDESADITRWYRSVMGQGPAAPRGDGP